MRPRVTVKGNGNGASAGIMAPDQIAARQPATIANTGYPSIGPSVSGAGSPMPAAAQGQNTAAGALVQSGMTLPTSWKRGSFTFGGRGSGRPAKRRASARGPKRAGPVRSRTKRKATRTARAKRMVKGSAAAKRYMAKLRRMRKRR